MRSSATESAARCVAGLAFLAISFGGTPVRAQDGPRLSYEEQAAKPNDDDLEARGEATLGADLYIIDGPYDDDRKGGFLDQYEYTRNKNDSPPFFVDLMHVDFGLYRDDDTSLVRIERDSPNQLNDKAKLEVDWQGLGLDVDYWRFRTEELRYFPEGTYQNPDPTDVFFPVYGTRYNADPTLAEPSGTPSERLWIRRTGIDGEVRFRPEAAGFTLPVLAEVSFGSGYEERKGWRQDSFVLDASELPPTTLGADDERFRGNRRRVDQAVTNVGAGFVLSPASEFTADFKFDFESFRENASAVTLDDIWADIDPTAGPAQSSTFNYVPDTNRLSGSTRLAGVIGDVSLHGSAFVTHLEQSNRAPINQTGPGRKPDKHQVTTWSLDGGFDVPLGEQLALGGFLKFAQRRNDMSLSDITPDPTEPLLSQVAPFMRRRDELDGELELSMRPQAGALVAAGYRFDWTDRSLRYAQGISVITEEVSLVERDSNQHTFYLRGRARLLRSIQLAGELGFDYQPEVSFPRDPRSTLYFDGRGTYSLNAGFPMSIAVFGGVRDAHGTGILLESTSGLDPTMPYSSVRKDVDRLEWNYGATVTAVPAEKTTFATTFTQSRDAQDMPYARTQFPRFSGPGNIFTEPRRVHWESDVKSVTVSASRQLVEGVTIAPFANVSWVKADFPNSSSDPDDISDVLEGVNKIDSRLIGVGANLSWAAMRGLELGFGYRFDQYVDHQDDAEPITRDDERHTFTLTATVDLDLFTALTN